MWKFGDSDRNLYVDGNSLDRHIAGVYQPGAVSREIVQIYWLK